MRKEGVATTPPIPHPPPPSDYTTLDILEYMIIQYKLRYVVKNFFEFTKKLC